MRKVLGLLVIGSLLIGAPAAAFTDICKIGSQALQMTSAQISELYRSEVGSHRVEGSGGVYDVRKSSGGINPGYIVVINCGNNVFATIYTGSDSSSIRDLKKGQKVSFTGDCSSLNQQNYVNSGERYIDAIIINAYLDY